MPAATVTSKGQITIPAEVRRDLGLRPGARVDFVRTDEGVYQLIPTTRTVTSLKGFVAALAEPVPLEAMDDAIAAAATESAAAPAAVRADR